MMSHEQSAEQDRGLFGLFGDKKDEKQKQEQHGSIDQVHGGNVSNGTGVGHESHTSDTADGYTNTGAHHTTLPGGEATKHRLLGKLHKHGNSSSSDEEAGEGKGRRKKGGIREKIKSVLPGHHKKEENPTIVMS